MYSSCIRISSVCVITPVWGLAISSSISMRSGYVPEFVWVQESQNRESFRSYSRTGLGSGSDPWPLSVKDQFQDHLGIKINLQECYIVGLSSRIGIVSEPLDDRFGLRIMLRIDVDSRSVLGPVQVSDQIQYQDEFRICFKIGMASKDVI